PGIFQFEDSPLVTLVGGTTLTSTGPGGIWASEKVWNNGYDPFDGHEDAGGGGVSLVYAIPSWQTNINMTTNMGSTTMRNIPDVALTADDIYIWGDGSPIADIGGTSCAAPLWAGFMSLVNQQIVSDNKSPIGFINPTIYALAEQPDYTNLFHDIVVGNNTNLVQTNLYYAVPGYDLCSGWGTPNGSGLINALVAAAPVAPLTPIIPAPLQPWGTTLSVMDGANPAGLWFLFIQDDTLNDLSGTNNGGWFLDLTTANPVGFPADNELYVSATNVTVTPGSEWVTTLAVTNYGPATATNVSILDTLPDPSGVSLVSFSPDLPGSSVSVAGNDLTWNVGVLPLNAGGTLSLTFRGNVIGVYTNGATVTSFSDPNPDDDSVGVSIAVASIAAPAIAPRFYPAGNKAFALSITNDAGSTVIIQASTNLVTWQPVATNIAPFTFTNFDNTNFPYRFYRAVVQPQ
ncbi:MAG TPA: hypothetical protein VL970_13560, partial [Candidatus Acidoferrales bacterium]|nr:hypothetical protein [Candidatus Acidoferrales bacterium]